MISIETATNSADRKWSQMFIISPLVASAWLKLELSHDSISVWLASSFCCRRRRRH